MTPPPPTLAHSTPAPAAHAALLPPPNPAPDAPGRGEEGPTGTGGGALPLGVWPLPTVSCTITWISGGTKMHERYAREETKAWGKRETESTPTRGSRARI